MSNTAPHAEHLREKHLTEVFRKYRSQLSGYIAARVPSKEDCEDILQDVFYRLARMDPEEKPVEHVSGWLYSVTRNLIIDKRRKRREEELTYQSGTEEDDSFIGELAVWLPDEDASPETEFIRTMVWEELETALAELPEEQRAVFELTELQGFSFKEIADSVQLPVNTLISRKRYAVLHLRKRLARLYEELLYK